jgi:ABC transporter fused permease/ATP-binding protein
MAKKRAFASDDDAPKAKLDKKAFKTLLGIYKFMMPYKGYFSLGLLCLFSSSFIMLAFPEYTGKLLDSAFKTEKTGDLNNIALTLIGILVIQGFFSFFRIYLFSQVSERSMSDLRNALYKKFMTLPMTFFDKKRTGELMSRITADIELLHDTFSITLAEFFRQLIILIAGIVLLFFKSAQLTLFMLAIVPVLMVGAMFFGKYIRKISKTVQDELAKSNIIVEETLQGIATVKSFVNEYFEVGRYAESQKTVVALALKSANYRGLFVSFIIFTLFGAIVAVLWFGTGLVADKVLTFGELTTFIIYTMFIAGSIGGLGDIYGQIQKAIGASERILEIIEQKSENTASEKVKNVFSPQNTSVRFEHVSFSYPTRSDVEVLKGIHFEAKSGEKLALVGYSGSGKSTTVQLLMRFYEPTGGRILVGGENIDTLSLAEYRSLFAVVPQEVLLFGGTVRENIAYGDTDASEEQIREAARKANALQFIEGFPEGFDTLVGERGVKLSGGQRQRIAIARAVLKNPKILILDEATSSLDAESEALVQEALEELMKNRTTIIIAHRLATIRRADKILVMNAGEIVENGTHESLIAKKGIYGQLVNLQTLETQPA